MDRSHPSPAKGKNIYLPHAYHVALKILRHEDGDATDADTVRRYINREMKARHGRDWEHEASEIGDRMGIPA